jgi:proteasome lid subunit RPN8/RPN11
MQPGLYLTSEHLDQITAHIDSCLPEEACGLVGGMDGSSRVVIPVENVLHSPVQFQMAPLEQLKAFDEIEKHGWELLAIFHSHPQGPAGPSATDIAEFYYPGTWVIIASPSSLEVNFTRSAKGLVRGKWRINAFSIENNEVYEVKLSLAV